MKIDLELPGWPDERTIRVMAGIELVAYKLPGGPWMVKNGRCSSCGQCCMSLRKHAFPVVAGRCSYLVDEPGNKDLYRCALGIARPYSCCVAIGSDFYKGCTESYVEAD